jgi:hypothetical protein
MINEFKAAFSCALGRVACTADDRLVAKFVTNTKSV